MIRYRLLSSAVGTAFALLVPFHAAHAQPAWPTKPIKLIVPYAPGGPVDGLARAIAPKLGEQLGQTVYIDSRPGASGSMGTDAVMKADPDGYTIGFGVPGAITVLPHLMKLPYKVDDINYVSLVARVPQVITVGPKVPVDSLKALIALAIQKPDSLFFGSAGNVTTPHLGMELLMQETGAKLIHVPYKGAAPAVTALLAGEVQVLAADLPAILPFLSKGVKVLAVSSASRTPALPDVPTTAELGLPNVRVESNYGLIAPMGTPPAITQKLRDALHKVLAMPDVKTALAAQGAVPVPNTPAQYRQLMEQESQRWAVVVKRGNVRLD